MLLKLNTVKSYVSDIFVFNKSSTTSCKLWATGPSCVCIIFLPRSDEDSHSPGTVLQRRGRLSQPLPVTSFYSHGSSPQLQRSGPRVLFTGPGNAYHVCFLPVWALVLHPWTSTVSLTFTANLKCRGPTCKWPIKCLGFSQNGCTEELLRGVGRVTYLRMGVP